MNKHVITLLFFIAVCSSPSLAQVIGGVGATLLLDTSGGYTMPRILSLVPKTPAYDSLRATDYIMKVNDVSCKNKTMEEVVGMIRGEAGTMVKVTVADTKEGKRPREYTLPRVSMQIGPAKDPLTAFNEDCENEVKQIKRKHLTVIKNVSSDCGNYFFNFDAGAEPCHIKLMTLEEKGTGAFSPGFYATAKVSEGDVGITELGTGPPKDAGNMHVALLEGTVTFKRPNVGTIAVTIHDDVKKCKGMYVLVYSDKAW